MKKKPQLPRKLGKPNALRKSVLSNRRDIENNNENKQLSQCVFLGVLRLKPVPTTFSRTSVPSGSTSFISHRLRRHRNNNTTKESNKNATQGVDLNKVISGKITKKNPDKVRACIKKNPLGTSKVLRICLTMNRAMMNLQSSNSEVASVTDIPFQPASSFGVTQPTFNPVDDLFNKLKQQLKHAESPGSLDVSMFPTAAVAKMNASKQVTSHAAKAKRKQTDNLTNSTDNNSDDIIWISDTGAIDHHVQTSNDDVIFIDDSKEVRASPSYGASTSATVLTDIDESRNSHTMQKSNGNQAPTIGNVSTKAKQATSFDQTEKIYEVDDNDSSSESVSQNKFSDKQKEKGKSRRNRLIPAEIPLKYVNAPRLLRSELYQKADQKRSTSLEGKDRTKDKSKSLKSGKVTFTIIKSSSEHNLSQKSRPELTVRKQKSQDASTDEINASGREKKKSSSPKNRNIQQYTSDRWEITSSTQMSDQALNVSGTSQKSTGQGEQPVSFKLKLTKTTRSSVAAAKATQSTEMLTDEVIFVEDTRKDTSLGKAPVDNAGSLHSGDETNIVLNPLLTPRLLRSDLTTQKPATKTGKNTNSSMNPSVKTVAKNMTIKDSNTSVPTQTATAPNISNNEDLLIIIDDADDTNINLQVPTRSLANLKIPEEKTSVVESIPIVENVGDEIVPRVLRSDTSQQIQSPPKLVSSEVSSGSSIPNKLGNGAPIVHPTKLIVEQLNKEKTRTLRSEISVKASNKELKVTQAESAVQDQVISARQNAIDNDPSSKGNVPPRVLRSDVSQKTMNNAKSEEQNHLVAAKSVTDKFTVKGNLLPTSVLRSDISAKITGNEQQPEQSEEKNKTVSKKSSEIVIIPVTQEIVIPSRVLRSEACKTITNEGPHEKQAELTEKVQDPSQPAVNDEKLPRSLRSDAKESAKTGSISRTQDKQDQVREQSKVVSYSTAVNDEKRTVRSDVTKATEISQVQLMQSADNQSESVKNLRTSRSVSPQKSASPKSNERQGEVEEKHQSVDVNRFYSKQPSKISSQPNVSSEPAAVPSKTLRSTSEQQAQQNASQRSKENLGKEQSTYPGKSGISQQDSAPKQQVENPPPSRMLRSDPKNIPDSVLLSQRKMRKPEEQQKKSEVSQVECSANQESTAVIVYKEKIERASRSVVADGKNEIPGNSNHDPDIFPKASKESAGTGTKVARSRSSSPSKAKNINFDEIIVLSERKSRKSKEAAMKVTFSEPRLPVKQTSIMEPAEEVVVIIHEEPKSKSAPLLEVKNTNQEDGDEKLQQGTEHLQRSLRSQKNEQNTADLPNQSDMDSIINPISNTENSTKLNDAVTANSRLLRSQQKVEQASSSRNSPENEISSKAGEKGDGAVKTAEVEIATQVTPIRINQDTSELQKVATARVLRSEAKPIDNVAQENKAQSPALSDAKKVSFKSTPEICVKDNTPKKTRKGNLKKKINDMIRETSMGRSILKKGKLEARDNIIKKMSKAFGKKQKLKVKVVAPNVVKSTQNSIKPIEDRVLETASNSAHTINSTEKSELKNKGKKTKIGKKIVFATKTKERFTKGDKKQQIQKIDTKKDKVPAKGKNTLPLALRRLLMDGRISRKTLVTPETSVTNTDDSESNKENVISKMENIVEKNIGPKTKKEQTKQKLLARMKHTISKGKKKELKGRKNDKKGSGKPQVRNSNGTPPKRNVQKKMNTTPPRKKNSEKVVCFKTNKPGKGSKPKVDKKEKKGKTDVNKALKSVLKPNKANEITIHNVENNLSDALNNRKIARMSTSTTESQAQTKKSTSKDKQPKGDSNQTKTSPVDKKNKNKNIKKCGLEAVGQVKVNEKAMKKSEKRKRKQELPSVKKMKLSKEPSIDGTAQTSENNSSNIKITKENKLASSKNVANVKASANTSNKKGKIKKNKVNVQVQTVPAVESSNLAPNSENTNEKQKKGMPKRSEADNSSEATSNIVVPRPRVSLRRSRIDLQTSEDTKPEIQDSTAGEEATKKNKETPMENKNPDRICETNIVQKRARKSILEAETAVSSRKSRGEKSPAIKKRQSKRACVVQQGKQEASKKICDVKEHIIVASCDSAVNTTITLPPGTSIEPIVIEDVKEEDPNKSNTLINNNIPTKPSLSVFDFNESDMELNTPPLLTLQNIREEIKEKHTYQKEHARDTTYVVPDNGPEPNNVTYTLSSNPPQDLNKTYTTLNPVPNASSKDALSALNTSISVKEPESHTFSPPQKSTPKMTKSVNQAKGPKLYSVIPAEEIVRKRIEQAEHLKARPSQSIDLTTESGPQLVQEKQIQVRRPSQICEPSKLKHNLPTTSSGVDVSGNTIQVKSDKVSPATPNSSTFEDLFKSPIKEPKKSPLKQTTILDMFAKMQQKNIIKAIFSQPETSHQESRMEPQSQQQQSTLSTLSRIPKDISVTTEVSAPIKEGDSSEMPPPKLTAYGEDEDSDGESRMEWVPEEYAEYKFKYTAKKVMSYKPIFKCKVCLQMFPTYYKLNKHKRQHSQTDNPYKCPQCETSFNSVADLAAHIRVHKGKHPYTCKKCDTGFWTKEELDEHSPVHLLKKIKPPEKKFRCDVCLKEFSRLYEVERHIRVHTGEKPFTCNICNKGYQQRHNLSKHLLIHLDVRPFHCEICGKAFGRSDVLDRHVLTHSVEKPVKCPHCDKDFIRPMQLKNHMRKRHKEFYDDATVDGVQKDESSGDPASTPPKEETANSQGTETKTVEPELTDPLELN